VLYRFGWRKKKAKFIISPTYFKNNSFSITEQKNNDTSSKTIASNNHIQTIEKQENKTELKVSILENQPKVSSLSLSSIKAKKELLEKQKSLVKDDVHLPTEHFTETQMLEQWFKYADRLGDRGHKIMESLMRIEEPILEGFKILHTLPNDSSKLDFDKEKHELLGYLRGKLHNHEITIETIVNETLDAKKAFTPLDKFNRLNEINPNLELLKKMFDLDF